MKGTIVNFKLGNKYDGRKIILELEGITSHNHASQFIGRKVVWIHPKSKDKIIGKIVRIHGKKGRVIAVFRKALPGLALGNTVSII
ncbi:MAG: 50S ribosomal protein L35ae [Thermoproteales archaeon]|nr:50S ribosomal protein L35ae [Thermoproteales archaeon]